MRLEHIARGLPLARWRRRRLSAVYWASTVAGLLLPGGLFRGLYPLLYAVAKSR